MKFGLLEFEIENNQVGLVSHGGFATEPYNFAEVQTISSVRGSLFFCNQKNEKFRGSDSPDPKRPRRGVYLSGVILFSYIVFVFTNFLPLNRRL